MTRDETGREDDLALPRRSALEEGAVEVDAEQPLDEVRGLAGGRREGGDVARAVEEGDEAAAHVVELLGDEDAARDGLASGGLHAVEQGEPKGAIATVFDGFASSEAARGRARRG